MHTLKVIGAGLLLLALCLGIARATNSSLGGAALVFIALWFVAAGVNLYIGVASAGYSVAAELPIFALVFGLPALLAFVLRWRVL